MAPLQYVFAYVSSDYLWENPAPVCVCMSLTMSTSGKYCPTLLAKKKVYFSWMCCYLQITSLLKGMVHMITM